MQVQLHNECCEELGTRVKLSKLSLNLNFKQTVSHVNDLKYGRIKIKELEKHFRTRVEGKILDFAPWVFYSFVYFYCNSVFVCYCSLDTVVKVQGNLLESGG